MDQWHKRWPGPSTLVSRTFETKRSTPVLMILAKDADLWFTNRALCCAQAAREPHTRAAAWPRPTRNFC